MPPFDDRAGLNPVCRRLVVDSADDETGDPAGESEKAMSMRWVSAGIFVLVAGACAGPRPSAKTAAEAETGLAMLKSPEAGCTVAEIVDGDTLVCEGGERVRLLLIDAPERRQPGYAASRLALEELTPPGIAVRLEGDIQAHDRYGRTLAYVWTGDVMANEEMVKRGYAVVAVYPPNVRHVERVRAAAAEARAARRGLWAVDGFACEPRAYRAGGCE